MISVKNKKLIKAVGERIRSLRLDLDISQEELANEADIPLSQVGRIERGETNPTISTLFVISEALKIELSALLDFKLKK
ncbi:MAG TPA: helix-turn-helix transcriptional regulator [Sediminibacterium sp.]|nr:MAG: anaerobic benzoate catabolism transcriptional regulator [Ignavibacteria bacterium ADurb.Bin266]HPH36263.1 helix-turn-helix transcriptional regulator [Sediminibacterium sp.]